SARAASSSGAARGPGTSPPSPRASPSPNERRSGTMLIAFAELSGAGNSFASDSGGVPQFLVSVRVTADDGTFNPNTTLNVTIPAGTNSRDFNDAIVQAVITWVNGQHSWSIDPKNIYFQPFCNGS